MESRRNRLKVKLTRDQTHRIKCWIDLNCPLWADYLPRLRRPATLAKTARATP